MYNLPVILLEKKKKRSEQNCQTMFHYPHGWNVNNPPVISLEKKRKHSEQNCWATFHIPSGLNLCHLPVISLEKKKNIPSRTVRQRLSNHMD